MFWKLINFIIKNKGKAPRISSWEWKILFNLMCQEKIEDTNYLYHNTKKDFNNEESENFVIIDCGFIEKKNYEIGCIKTQKPKN